jgi:hypothetical protein
MINDDRPGIEKHIWKAFESFQNLDMEDALYQIAPTIDVTAKKRYPNKRKVGERIKAFIFDEQTLIYYLSTQGRIMPEGIRIVIVDENTNKPVGNHPDHAGELADFIYHNIRCAQSHGAKIDYSLIDIGREFGIGRVTFENDRCSLKPGIFVISKATVLALILSVVCSPENEEIRLSGDLELYNRITLSWANLVGNKKYLMETLFQLLN